MSELPDHLLDRLAHDGVVWCTTLRPDGSPHTTPVWFVHRQGLWWVPTAARSVKVRNVRADPRVSLALPDGAAPVVAEGRADVCEPPFPQDVVEALAHRYSGWDVTDVAVDGPRVLLAVTVTRWLMVGRA